MGCKFIPDFLAQFRVAQDHESPVLDVETGGRLNRGFEKLGLLFLSESVVGIELLDRAALVDGVSSFHWSVLRVVETGGRKEHYASQAAGSRIGSGLASFDRRSFFRNDFNRDFPGVAAGFYLAFDARFFQ